MNDLISRLSLKQSIVVSLILGGEKTLEQIIDEEPSVDAVPVKHGTWQYIGGYGYQHRCSECIMCVERISKYCPHCGARMDGEKE